MGTKLKQYILLRSFGEFIIRDIQTSDDPDGWEYSKFIMGYSLGITQALELDKSEASNIKKEAEDLTVRAAEECERVNYVHRYNKAVEYLKNRLSKCETLKIVLRAASADEIINLYHIAWTIPDTCDFYDAYDDLENKYTGGHNESNS